MPSATLTTKDHSDQSVTLTLVGSSDKGATYKDVALDLSLPFTLEQTINLGQPGSKGNDRLNLKLTRVMANAAGVPLSMIAQFSLSIPRDPVWTNARIEDIINELCYLLGGTAGATNRVKLAEGTTL